MQNFRIRNVKRILTNDCSPSRVTTRKGTLNAVKVQYRLYTLCFRSELTFSMEWNMEENFSME